MRKYLALFLLPVIAASGCMPSPESDDNGNTSWVQQAVPELLGRRARGWEESHVLAQAVDFMGREKVSQAIMTKPEFVNHWTDLVMDHLQVQRKGDSGNRNADYECWQTPKLASHDWKLARWVEAHNPDKSLSYAAINPGSLPTASPRTTSILPWNMNDLIRSALLLDDLSPVYLANLIPFQMNPGYNSESRRMGRERLGNKFDEIYLGRNQGCMSCHSEAKSSSNTKNTVDDVSMEWIRTHPQNFLVDEKIFNFSGDEFGFGSEDTINASHAPFNPHFRGGEFTDPWSINLSCVRGRKFQNSVTGLTLGLPNSVGNPHAAEGEPDPETPDNDPITASLATINGMHKSILDVEQSLRAGMRSLSGTSLESHFLESGNDALNPDEAMAYLVALNITNNVWQQIMGERLTIAHGYSRNVEQRDMHRFLTEDKLLPGRWSLRDVLTSILASSWFNRAAPYASNTAVFDSPYQLPMVLDPWLALAPWSTTTPAPENEANSQGRVVHRYAPRTLVRSAASALDHPVRFDHLPTQTSPDYQFAKNMGQYLNDYLPGMRSSDLVSVMTWSNEYGSCQKPSGQAEDWIDRLSAQAMAWDADNPSQPPLQLRDVVLTLKDRLIGEPNLDADVPDGMPGDFESQSIQGVFGGYSLSTPVSYIGEGGLEDGARAYCGALVTSPQFMLAGIRPAEQGEFPRLRVCSPDEPCGWTETCQDWLPALEQVSGLDLQCYGGKVGHKLEFNLERPDGVEVPRQEVTDSGPSLENSIPPDADRFELPPPPPPPIRFPPEPDPSPEDSRLPSSMPTG